MANPSSLFSLNRSNEIRRETSLQEDQSGAPSVLLPRLPIVLAKSVRAPVPPQQPIQAILIASGRQPETPDVSVPRELFETTLMPLLGEAFAIQSDNRNARQKEIERLQQQNLGEEEAIKARQSELRGIQETIEKLQETIEKFQRKKEELQRQESASQKKLEEGRIALAKEMKDFQVISDRMKNLEKIIESGHQPLRKAIKRRKNIQPISSKRPREWPPLPLSTEIFLQSKNRGDFYYLRQEVEFLEFDGKESVKIKNKDVIESVPLSHCTWIPPKGMKCLVLRKSDHRYVFAEISRLESFLKARGPELAEEENSNIRRATVFFIDAEGNEQYIYITSLTDVLPIYPEDGELLGKLNAASDGSYGLPRS